MQLINGKELLTARMDVKESRYWSEIVLRGGSGSQEKTGRFSEAYTPSKNPAPVSWMQAYIAYTLQLRCRFDGEEVVS